MKKFLPFLLLLTPFFGFLAPNAFSQSTLNVTLTGSLSYTSNLSDVWGYVDNSGDEWAIVGVFNGVSLVDLSDPTNPVEQFFIPGANSTWRDMKTWGNYAYITNETSDGLRIIDLSNLPTSINSKDTVIDGMTKAHNIYIDSAGYAYIAGANIDNGGITILDLNSDPWNPNKVGAYTAEYAHDVYVRNDTAFISEVYAGALTMVDVSNKAAPFIIGSVITPDQFAHNAWTSDDGQYCFVTEEVNAGYITAWDVSDPTNITELDRIRSSQSNGLAVPHNTHYLNGFLVTSYYADGLNIIDANRPENLVEVGYYDTNTQTGGGTSGLWGAYPWLPSGIVLGTDMGTGFFVFNPTYERAAYLEGTATEALNGNDLSGVILDVQTTSLSETTDNAGEYKTGIAGGGTFTVSASKFGYSTIDTTLTLSPGQVVIWNPVMTSAPTISFSILVEDAATGNPIPNAEVVAISQGQEFSYIANANGVVTDPAFIEGMYEIVAGKWGYVTNGINHNANSGNNSITLTLDKGYYDDFIFDYNWVIDAGTASSGVWEWGEPVGTYFFGFEINPETDTTADYGDKCLITGNAGGSVSNDEVTGRTWVTSPEMNLADYNNPYLLFDFWFGSFAGQGVPGFRDSLVCEINNGTTTQKVWFVNDDLLFGWIPSDTIWVSNFLPLTGNMTVTFRASENLTNHWMECAIDRVRIEDSQTVGVAETMSTQGKLKIWPNPSNGNLNIEVSIGAEFRGGKIVIHDLQGREVWRQNATTGINRLETHLPQGMYVVGLEQSGISTSRTKVVINH